MAPQAPAPPAQGEVLPPKQGLRTVRAFGVGTDTGAFPPVEGPDVGPGSLPPVGSAPVEPPPGFFSTKVSPSTVLGSSVAVAGTAEAIANYYACLQEGHSEYDCMKETGVGAAEGMVPVAGGALVGAGVGWYTGAGVIAGAAVGATVTGAVLAVPATLYGAYYVSKRLGEAPAVAADKKLADQQAINASLLPRALQELDTIFQNEETALESLQVAAMAAGRAAASRSADVQKALDDATSGLAALRGFANGLIGSFNARCATINAATADFQALAGKADIYRKYEQDAEWLATHASDACPTPAAAAERAARLQSAQTGATEVAQWAEQLRAKQADLVALKSGMDADLQAMDRADEMEGQVVTAVGRVTSLISGYQADVDKYNGLRTEFQQRLAVLRDKVEHLPDAVPNPPADFARLTATMMASWRDRLAEFSGVGADVPLAPPSADAQASAVNARIEAENLISALRAAADACGVDTGADAVNTANGLAASIAAGLAAAGNAPQTTASCPSPNQPQGQPPAGSVTGADASNVTGFEPVKTDEKTVGQPPTGATTGTDTKPPAGATGTDATNPTGAGQTGFEPTKTDERTAPTGAGQGITLAGTTASDRDPCRRRHDPAPQLVGRRSLRPGRTRGGLAPVRDEHAREPRAMPWARPEHLRRDHHRLRRPIHEERQPVRGPLRARQQTRRVQCNRLVQRISP